MPHCILNMRKEIEDFKVRMNLDEPGWVETEVRCQGHRTWHVLLSDDRQGALLAEMREAHTPDGGEPRGHRLPPIPAGKPETWCRWHETASPQLVAPCAWCGTALHVHQDALGTVKSGRTGQGFLVQSCPACHRDDAIYPVYGKRAIRTSKMEGETPVMQLTFGRM